MDLSDREVQRAQQGAEAAQQTLSSLGLGSGKLAELARATAEANAAILGQYQDVISRADQLQKVLAVSLPAAGLLTGSAWGVANMAEKWSKMWPHLNHVSRVAKEFQETMQRSLAPMIHTLEELARNSEYVRLLQNAWLEALPENLRGVRDLRLSALCDFLAEEGIPLYLVPRQSTVEAFLAARDRGAVRALPTTRARSITTDCQVVWRSHRTTRTTEWVDLLEAGLAAYEAGHTEAAQALFANVLDSITFAIPGPDRRRYTNHKWGDADYEHLLEEDLATGLAIMPLWRVHEENWADKGHDVPREFNRHATLHRVSSRQYTKRNALQSMMLATSLLAWTADYGRLPDTESV